MRKIGRLGLCLILTMMIAVMSAPAMADMDLSATGSVSVRIHTASDVNVKNAHIELFFVGAPAIENYNLRFDLTPDFAGSGVSLSDLSDASIAAALDAWIDANSILPNRELNTGADGRVTFESVPTGLYLVRQDRFANGRRGSYSEIAPFIVTVPMTQDSEWVYEIDAQPKVNPVVTPEPTIVPSTPPGGEDLPQTGVVRWPIPVLGLGGVVLFSVGWALFFGKKKAGKNA